MADAKIYIPYCHALNDNIDAAVRLYRAFLAEFPESPDRDWVQGQVEKLTAPPEEEGK